MSVLKTQSFLINKDNSDNGLFGRSPYILHSANRIGSFFQHFYDSNWRTWMKIRKLFCFCFLLNLGNVKIYFSSHHLFEFSNISLRYLSKWIILKNGKKISLPTQVQGWEFANWNVEIPLTCFRAIFIIFQKNWYVCLLFVSFHFSFFVSFEDKVTKIRKYYVIFVYIL